jgi:tetratricopeptide (TPR) repeat protein
MFSRLTLLAKLAYSPLDALSELRTRSPYLAGGLLALLTSLVYYDLLGRDLWILLAGIERNAFDPEASFILVHLLSLLMEGAAPVLFLAVIFAPAVILAASLVGRGARFSILLREEYAPLVTCLLYSWAIAHILLVGPAMLLFRQDELSTGAGEFAVRFAPLPYFAFLAVLSVKTVLRLSSARSLVTVGLASVFLLALPLLPGLLFVLSSPFLLILTIILLRSFLGEMISAHEARERFKRSLQTATLNPADASAHYNLGLIYQQRGLYKEAAESFARAVEIDPDEVDAHYQLGRIARSEGRLADAISCFDSVVRRSSDHSQNEVWREIGSTYFQAGQYDDARTAFERFVEKRGGDAEGLYRYGLTLHRLGRSEEAASQMQAVIEAVRTAPAYKYRAEKHWMREAQSFLRAHKDAAQV